MRCLSLTSALLLLSVSSYPTHRQTLFRRGVTLESVKKDNFNTYTIPLGYHDKLQLNPKDSVIIHGSNAIEHTVNLIDESGVIGRRVLVVCGWNVCRVDPLMWELEPRDYEIWVESISSEPSPDDVGRLVNEAMVNSIDIIFAMGGGSVVDACKAAVTILRNRRFPEHESVPWLKLFQGIFESDEIDYLAGGQRPLLVTVPIMPLIGSEVNQFSCILPPSPPTPSEIMLKDYIRTVHPDICVIQPNSFFRLPMSLLHDRIVSLFSLAVELLILNDDFRITYTALDSIKKLSPILLSSMKVIRF